LTLSLCTATYLLFVGGVARLIGALAREDFLPRILAASNREGAPVGAIVALTAVHLAVALAASWGAVTVETLVALADGFFIANATIGIAAAYKLFPGLLPRLATLLLGLFFVVIFCHSHILVILFVLTMAAATFAGKRMVGATEGTG
ncbi:MAG: Amino acid permease-associated protein, partial [uncultured bacterium]